ncbi:MAG TPA: HEAT repeat domain-containing protein [Verrucomicrobiae bacterium]|nr:HEAT repeat domain-containing protein [Verrucomicrobiae bacterium]
MHQRLKRILIGVIAGMAALVGGFWILIHTVGEREPRFEGQRLEYWQAQLESRDTGASNTAKAIVQSRVIPRLSDIMFHDTKDSKLRLAVIEELNKLPGVMIYYTPAEGRRAQAAGSLAAFGPSAQVAIPDLIRVIKSKDEAVRVAAVSALGPIRGQPETVIPLLISCLGDPQDGVPVAAVESLGYFGAGSRPAWPKLVPLLKVRDKELLRALKTSLRQIDPEEAAKLGIK